MFAIILDMVLAVALSSVKSASHITQNEWTLIESVNNALNQLLTKKPPNIT